MSTATQPKISIILPTYNRAKYIVETVDSVQRQTYTNWELWVIDDRSTDNSGELIRKIDDERVRLHQTERRLGVTGTRNEGLRKADGELIAFIDSDDLWADTKLEKQVAALQQYPEAGFSLSGGYNFRKPNEPVDFFYKQREGIKCDNVFISFFKSELSTTTPSLVFRRECIDSAGLFKETSPFSDIDFILSLAYHFKAIILYEPLLYRRLHEANDSNANWIKGYNKGIELIQSYKKDLPAKIARDALFRLYINFGEDCLLYKERRKAIQHFLNAWKNKPYSIVPLKKTGKAIIQYLKKTLPASSELDLLTRKEADAIPKNIQLFDHVYSISGGRNVKKQLLHTCWLLPKLLLKRYDVVIDLQNNEISRLVRRTLMPG